MCMHSHSQFEVKININNTHVVIGRPSTKHWLSAWVDSVGRGARERGCTGRRAADATSLVSMSHVVELEGAN